MTAQLMKGVTERAWKVRATQGSSMNVEGNMKINVERLQNSHKACKQADLHNRFYTLLARNCISEHTIIIHASPTNNI